MASRWHRRTAVAIVVGGMLSIVAAMGPVIVDAVQRPSSTEKLYGEWRTVEVPYFNVRFEKSGLVSFGGEPCGFEASEGMVVITSSFLDDDPPSSYTYSWRINWWGRLLLQTEIRGKRISHELRRVKPDDSNAGE